MRVNAAHQSGLEAEVVFARRSRAVKISDGLRVRLKVKLQVKGGDVIEQSVVEYFQGAGTMLQGLEDEIAGLEPGAKKTGVIAAARAFGNAKHQPTKKIARSEFPAEATLKEGEKFEAKGANGQDIVLQVLKNDGTQVEVKFVHPLAEKDIEYDVSVIAVTDPTPPPLPAEAVASESDD